MSAVLSSLVAVAGTLLGSAATFFFQRASADRTAALGFVEKLRQDRLNAYNAFGDAAIEYRRAENDRWFRLQEGDGEASQAAAKVAHTTRASARSALVRIALLTSDTRMQDLGNEIIQVSRSISQANGADEREKRAARAKLLIDAVIERAAAQVQSPPRQLRPTLGLHERRDRR
ncbi:hypothetical protein [Nocardia panacis]|uniref:hypothetical protein n=1 Tax=Nocardia panacis TaxID=2340916 RepID=UPI0011C46959|nr:hypothetical protein [Nocardia panacis]